MEFFETVAKRYSHKAKFDPSAAVSRGDLRKIVEAGMAAPSAGNNQSPEFVIIDDPALLAKVGEITGNEILRSAPALILILSRPEIKETLSLHTECLIADFSAAAENMLLAATALGYCCAWQDGAVQGGEVQAKFRDLFAIPEDRLIAMVVPVGQPGEESARRQKKPFQQRASWNRYEVQRGE